MDTYEILSDTKLRPLAARVRWTKCERENKFKFIFTSVYWREKMNIYFKFTSVFGGAKTNLNLFSLPFTGDRK